MERPPRVQSRPPVIGRELHEFRTHCCVLLSVPAYRESAVVSWIAVSSSSLRLFAFQPETSEQDVLASLHATVVLAEVNQMLSIGNHLNCRPSRVGVGPIGSCARSRPRDRLHSS